MCHPSYTIKSMRRCKKKVTAYIFWISQENPQVWKRSIFLLLFLFFSSTKYTWKPVVQLFPVLPWANHFLLPYTVVVMMIYAVSRHQVQHRLLKQLLINILAVNWLSSWQGFNLNMHSSSMFRADSSEKVDHMLVCFWACYSFQWIKVLVRL